MKSKFLVLILITLSVTARTQSSAIYNLRSDTIDVLHYNINLEIKDFTTHVIKGFTTVTFSPKMASVNKISLDLLALTVDSVKFAGSPITSNTNDTLLICHFPSPVLDADTVNVTVYYHGVPQADPTWGGFYFQGTYAYNLGVGFTSEPHNFGRVWYPCFDNFVEKATYDMHITTAVGKVAYCNGTLLSDTIIGSDVIRHWALHEPIPSYLACVAVNNYVQVNQDYVSTVTGTHIPINLVSLATDTTNFKNSFVNLHSAIQTYEEHFHPYAWSRVGYVAVPFSSGAMEHATLIAYPVAALTGTGNQNVMAHELSHHWWGDLVTCETAEDMWINEGMARWCEALFFEKLNGYGPGYMNDIRPNHKQVVWKTHITDGAFYPISGVPQSVTYGSTTYEKGADMIHTLRGYLGDSLFFAGLRSIQNTYKFKNLNATQFRDHLNSILPVSVTDYFNDWVFQPGFPEFAIDSMQVTGSAPSCSIKVYYRQKLRGATHYANNVPMVVTFMDNNLNHYTVRVMLGGASANVTVPAVPFVPTVAFFNEDERISEAVTASQQKITTNGVKAFANANFSMNVQSVTDTVWARVEHHWVAADPFIYSNFLYTISPDRFWRVSMAGDLAHFYTKATISYNGGTTTNGYLDNELMAALPLFSEDSLRLLYRASAADNWQVCNTATFTTGTNKTDKTGSITIDSLKPGDYALAIKTSSVGITEPRAKNNRFKLYPNPSNGIVTVEVKNADVDHDSVFIIDQQGNKVMTVSVRSTQTQLNVSGLASGAYFVVLVNGEKPLETQKLIVK